MTQPPMTSGRVRAAATLISERPVVVRAGVHVQHIGPALAALLAKHADNLALLEAVGYRDGERLDAGPVARLAWQELAGLVEMIEQVPS